MPNARGLTASELPSETLCAGDSIEYYSPAFVCGDPRAHRLAVVVRVAQQEDYDYPIALDTREILIRTTMVRRKKDKEGNPVTGSMWRKIRTFNLVDSICDAPLRSARLNRALRTVVSDVFAALRGQQRDRSAHEESEQVGEVRNVGAVGTDQASCFDDVSVPPVVAPLLPVVEPIQETPTILIADSSDGDDSDVRVLAVVPRANSAAGDSEKLGDIKRGPTEEQTGIAVKGFLAIRTRDQVSAAGHKAKRKKTGWHVPRSRKPRYQAKCVLTRDTKFIYHASTLRAKFIQDCVKHPTIAARVNELRKRRPVFKLPEVPQTVEEKSVVWPTAIRYLVESLNPHNIKFPAADDLGMCDCEGDCFFGVCQNSLSAVYCTPQVCKLGGCCSNAPILRETLRLFQTDGSGLGVYTTISMEVGDIVGEYCGVLIALDGVRSGELPTEVQFNSGYTMLFNTRSDDGRFVYIEPATYGTITRFINHACKPNAAFVEMRNGTSTRILVTMTDTVAAGTEITVSYGKEFWFTCKCSKCKLKRQPGGPHTINARSIQKRK